MIDMTTGKVLPDDDPKMVALRDVWARTKWVERNAFHEFTCLGARGPFTLAMVRGVQARFQRALEKL